MKCYLLGHSELKLQITFFMMGLEGRKEWLQGPLELRILCLHWTLHVSDLAAETLHIHPSSDQTV